jgi:hypothetical protein
VIKDSYYTLEFQFDKSSEGLDHLFPSIELLIRSMENIDRYLVSSVGYSLTYKRYLKNIGEDSFTFSIRVRLFQPVQIALGQTFPLEDVQSWMEEGRQYFVSMANREHPEEPGSLRDTLEQLIRSYRLDSTILFHSISHEELQRLSEDLNNAVIFLGGRARII